MSSSRLSKNHHYGCIGREEKHRKMMEVWQTGNNRIFNCHGGKETGKSCFIRKFLDDLIQNEASYSIVIDMDFKGERIGPKDSVKFWRNLAKKLERLKLVNQISYPMMEESLENFFEEIKERKIIFLLDNLDYARNAKADDKSSKTEEEDLFSELQDNFIPGIVERTDLSMVFITSTVQLRYGQIAPTVHKIEMDPLSTESAGDLLLKTIELTSNDNMGNKAAREHLGPYLQPIALLSEGIPMAVIVTGTQLTENNFFINPKDMLTVLIFSRMYTLSPEFFPKEDNMFQTYGDYIEKQSSGMKERLHGMGNTENSSFTVEELMQHLPAKDGKAFFKTQTLTPMLIRNFIKNLGNPDKSEKLEMPGFLREFVIIEKIIDSSKGLAVEDRMECKKVVSDCLHRLGKDLDVDELRRIIANPNEYDEFVEQIISSPTPEEDRFLDTQKNMEKNDLEKPFIGYSPESLLGCTQESNLSDLPEQRMQNLKLSEKDTDQDSHSSFNPGTPNAELQGEQTQDYILPGQLGEHLLRFNYNVSNMPPSTERSPQSIAHAGFVYKENDIFQCQYCQAQILQNDLSGNVDIMQRHQEINPGCPFVRQDLEYRGKNASQQVEDKESLNKRKKSKTVKGGADTSASTAIQAGKDIMEEIEREFLQLGVTGNGQETNGMDTKKDKFDNSSNLSSSYGDKQYPHNKMAPSVMDHTGPKEAENGVGLSPISSSELNYVRDQCMKNTDEKGAQGNSLHEIDVNTEKKRSYMEHKVNRTSKDDEGYASPHASDSDERASPDPEVTGM
ncbi:hypothetical protein CHS0354_006015 [Potamilus streckersoni]|uniref:Uncharacterized protein n=1 Tax=Potamilus streckersoni TaxID=2493646 RepID=A0AAE0VGF2_9BIVA|nr:hypothetical protein CHS0354_006015 [Potamilus streckersoni]